MSQPTVQPIEARPLDVLRHVFGFSAFRQGQAEIVDAILARQDVLAVMPTGAGKSLCFQLPAIMHPGFAVIVSPLIALMENQVALLRDSGVMASMIHSGRARQDNIADWQAVVGGRAKLLYMSPERLTTPRMQQALSDLPVSCFVIDEAHCISQWGHDFRKEYLALSQLKKAFPSVPLAAFTATADENTRKDLQVRLFGQAGKVFITGFDRPNITIKVEEKSRADRRIIQLADARRGQQGIIYCLSRRATEEMASKLSAAGHKAHAYHAGMSDAQRAEVLNRFLSEPDLVICATIAFGMGIDKPDIRYVIHRDLPGSMESYYQEIGRAGRDGEPAEAILLYGYNDLLIRRRMIDDSDAPDEIKHLERRRLDALAHYCDSHECRRTNLLGHFGDKFEQQCGTCDRCLSEVETEDATQQTALVLRTILATGENFGQQHIIHILTGRLTDKIRDRGHDRLAEFGHGKALDERTWRRVMRQLYAQKIIETMGEYHIPHLTTRGQQVLAGGLQVNLMLASLEKPSTKTPLGAGQVNAKLLSQLKKLRLDLARQKKSPAFVIFSDRTLIEMAEVRPRTKEQFSQLTGVGDKKCDAYASIFLKTLDEFEDQ